MQHAATAATVRPGVAARLIAFATLLAYVYEEISYSTSMPTSPQPETGRVKANSVNHGFIVYVTEAELRRAHLIRDLLFLFRYLVWARSRAS